MWNKNPMRRQSEIRREKMIMYDMRDIRMFDRHRPPTQTTTLEQGCSAAPTPLHSLTLPPCLVAPGDNGFVGSCCGIDLKSKGGSTWPAHGRFILCGATSTLQWHVVCECQQAQSACPLNSSSNHEHNHAWGAGVQQNQTGASRAEQGLPLTD